MDGPLLPFITNPNAAAQLSESGHHVLSELNGMNRIYLTMKLPVKALPPNDSGRLLVRLNIKHRQNIPRYGIARLTNDENKRYERVLVLGHDDDTAIFMPYDIREALGVDKGAELEFSIKEVKWYSKVYWLLKSRDPAVHVPAWLALASVLLGLLGVVVALFV